jgi:hypothetical protein
MGRPQDWLMVGMSLVILLQAHRLSGEEAGPRASDQRTGSPFAYIREDGTEIPVPAEGRDATAEPVRFTSLEDLHADSGFEAVMTWSSPVSASTTAP